MVYERRPAIRYAVGVYSLVSGLSGSAVGDDLSFGKEGMAATTAVRSYGVSGDGVGIGQVELDRPGRPKLDSTALANKDVVPTQVFIRTSPATKDVAIHPHAESVAGVIIGAGKGALAGIAPKASLYSAADTSPDQPGASLTTQNIAQQQFGDVRAINLSYGILPVAGSGVTNGSDPFTLFVDWSGRRHDVLYIAAGNENSADGFTVPMDNYNGIIVGATTLKGGEFRQVADFNRFDQPPIDGRRMVSLLAPGTDINMAGLNDATRTASGTSYAAPHVTGTAALLQEFADREIQRQKPGWSVFANAHQVMKAILLDSAEKLKLTDKVNATLNSDKELVRKDGTTQWANSPGHPIDEQMGTGQLDADRALYEFKQGQQAASAPVSYAGWDFGSISQVGSYKKYQFKQQLLKDSYFSATLAWDRIVDLNDWGNDGQPDTHDNGENNFDYDPGETFSPHGFANLDLYLLPQGDSDLTHAIASSTSSLYTIEHLFFKLTETGYYDLWVRESQAGPLISDFYGLAWRAVAAVPEPNAIPLLLAAALFGLKTRKGTPHSYTNAPPSKSIAGSSS